MNKKDFIDVFNELYDEYIEYLKEEHNQYYLEYTEYESISGFFEWIKR
jgi:hypothetical protein